MFHQGDLQSGIALAIQEAKSVVCFVRDDGEESKEWENEWLQQEQVSEILSAKSIVLRIEAGSQEAGFLQHFAPIKEAPSIAVIHNGQLVEFMFKGVEKADFNQRIVKAVGGGEQATETPAQPSRPVAAAEPTPTAAAPTPAAPSQPEATAQKLREEREARLKAKGKQKQEDPVPTPQSPAENKPARNTWIEEQKQRKADARRERERVMAQIEADKAERRAKREQERKAREEAKEEVESSPLPTRRSQNGSKATVSNLQVRLLDGGQIRKQFPATATLETDVRPWIDENLEAKAPYTLKQILAPQPARVISISEEHQTLKELDLLPSATLVLQPVEQYADAYAPGPVGSLLALPYNAVSGAYNMMTSSARWLRGGVYTIPDGQDERGGNILGDAAAGQEGSEDSDAPQPQRQPARDRNTARIRTLADQRDGSADQQFYNGNSLDFQPNAGEDKKK